MFLALVLMLNGIASAMAAVHHSAGPNVPPATSEATEADPAAGGHAHDGCAELDPGLAEKNAPKNAPKTGGTHGAGHSPGPDCCESGTCQGACANAGLPALPPDGHSGFGTPGQRGARPMASWHAAPALPHLMRPPIS